MCHRSTAAFFALVLIFLTGCESTRQFKHTWSLNDMVSGCKPWMSVQVKIDNDTNLLNVSLKSSTGSLVKQQLHVHTSRRNFTARNRVPCLYRSDDGGVFATAVRGLLKITFRRNDAWYSAEKLVSSSEPVMAQKLPIDDGIASRCSYVTPPNDLRELKLDDGYPKYSTVPPNPVRRKRSVLSFQGSASKKVLELAIVIDRSFVTKSGSEGSAVARAMEITNYANGIYESLGLQIVITNIVIWSYDPFTMTSDSTQNLYKFITYKAMNIDFKHDAIALMSATEWTNVLGVAVIQGLCNRVLSVTILSDRYLESLSSGLVLTHEIGHNLGFEHDDEISGCICRRTGACVMGSALNNRLEILNWSSCSVDAWNSQANAPWRSCLADSPDTSYYRSRSAVCGNGIIESGEQCDCGPAATCASKCCNATTCRLKAGAVCASGACCDWSNCTLRSRGDQCRAAVGPCDVAETCNGSSEWCPSDDLVADGVECANGRAYCYNGQCKTTDAQCQTIFSSYTTTGNRVCFINGNTRGDWNGHCEKRLQSVAIVSSRLNRTYSYSACTAANAECGLLHCYQNTKPEIYSSMNFSGGIVCYSQPDFDYSSSGVRSPSLVPDGAKCGTSSMCINSNCIPLASVRNCPDCPSCNGRGILTKAKVCFCNPGFHPPDCASPGCGGSITAPVNCTNANNFGTTDVVGCWALVGDPSVGLFVCLRQKLPRFVISSKLPKPQRPLHQPTSLEAQFKLVPASYGGLTGWSQLSHCLLWLRPSTGGIGWADSASRNRASKK